MDLQDKLKYYRQGGKNDHPARIEPHITDLCNTLEAELVDMEAAPVLKIEKLHPYGHFIPGLDQLTHSEIQIPLLSQHQFLEKIPLENVLLFDLETTGLAGGAGTFPFLLGFAVFKPLGLQTIQYFLPDYGRENIAFLAMRSNLKEKNILLSFNGKSFDYPLIRNRFILNRMDDPFAGFEHLDLLHVARRMWRGVLSSCSLQSIEREVFLFSRFGDLGGWLIPQAYFDFIRTGSSDEIVKIIDHNALDLMSLARLFLHLHHIENTPASNHEIMRLMHLAIKRGHAGQVDELLSELKIRKAGIPERIMADFSLLLKRNRQWERVVPIWNKLSRSRDHVLFAHLELAKYYEHNARDYAKAENHVQRALQYINTLREVREDMSNKADIEKLRLRLERIQTKISNDPSADYY